jgi:hypothetical protein
MSGEAAEKVKGVADRVTKKGKTELLEVEPFYKFYILNT